MPDSKSFDELYEASYDRLVKHALALGGNLSDAQDAVQEAFVRAWLRWDRVGRYEDPEGWVRRVAHNLAVSRWRRSLRAPRDVDLVSSTGGELGAELVAALGGLPLAERRALVLHHLVGLSVSEIALECHAPEGSVKSWLSRGRRRLADELRGGGPEEDASRRQAKG